MKHATFKFGNRSKRPFVQNPNKCVLKLTEEPLVNQIYQFCILPATSEHSTPTTKNQVLIHCTMIKLRTYANDYI